MGSNRISVEGAGTLRETRAQLIVVAGPCPVEEHLYELMPEERARAAGMAHRGSRERFILGRVVLRRALANFWGLSRPQLFVDPHGKPRIRGVNSRDFNLSHTEGGVAVALGSGEVGVDV
ncbi:MAG: hypothetical protein AAF658_11090, partial [Myxococcota bacterium]